MAELTQVTDPTASAAIQSFLDARIEDQVQQSEARPIGARSPFLITRVGRLLDGEASMVLWCNPSSASWSFTLRGNTVKVKNGVNFHYWYDSDRGTYYDDARLSLNFQSGSIAPLLSVDQSGDVVQGRVPPGHRNFFDFAELLNDQRILDDGSPNQVIIVYNSRKFPRIVVIGEFDPQSGFSVDDTADDSEQINWSATFVVQRTIPEIWETAQLQESVRSANKNLLAGRQQ